MCEGMEKMIFLFGDDGLTLGSVCKQGKKFVLVDNSGNMIQRVSMKITVKEAKEILLRKKEKLSEVKGHF